MLRKCLGRLSISNRTGRDQRRSVYRFGFDCVNRHVRLLEIFASPLTGRSARADHGRPSSCTEFVTKGSSVQRLDSDVLVEHRAFRIVSLKRDRAGSGDSAARPLATPVPVRGLRPLHDLFVVHLYDDRVAFDSNRLGEPLIVPGRRVVEYVDYMIKAAGSDTVSV